MPRPSARKRAVSKLVTKRFVNPVVRRLLEHGLMPRTHALLETTGRKSGLPRRVPVGNGLRGDTFWIVTEHGYHADYVKNIQAGSARAREGRAASGTAGRRTCCRTTTCARACASWPSGERRDRAAGRPRSRWPCASTWTTLSAHGTMPRRRLIVDAMNVIGCRPTGWWRDRRGAMTRLVEELGRYAADTGEEVTVVLDSDPFDVAAPGLDVRFAGRARDAADDAIVDMVAAALAAGVPRGRDIGQAPGGPGARPRSGDDRRRCSAPAARRARRR